MQTLLKFCAAAAIMLASLSVPHLSAEDLATGEQPDIVIREEEDKTFYEYRVNGILKEIKVVPKVGPEYYLVPADGEGWIREERSQMLVPKWVLFEW